MRLNLNREELCVLKLALSVHRCIDEERVWKKDKVGNYFDKMSVYGTTINTLYPLLNPDLDKTARLKNHNTWWSKSKIITSFLTEVNSDNEKSGDESERGL